MYIIRSGDKALKLNLIPAFKTILNNHYEEQSLTVGRVVVS